MAKRRLNQQQLRRISSNQQRRGKRGVLAADAAVGPAEIWDELGAEQSGLVICHYGQHLDIESLEDDTEGEVFRCHQRSNLPALVTGDRVVWQAAGPGTGVVVALQERRSVLSRPSSHRDQRPVAANVDLMVIVIAPLPQPFGNLIDRYLVAAENLGLQAMLLLNKTDMLDPVRDAYIDPLLTLYRDIGYEVIRASSRETSGTDSLLQSLADRTAVFVGQSGVGKSSLINALRGVSADDEDVEGIEPAAAVGALSTGHEKGTHTTTATRLYHLPGSGDLIDSPGIREFGLWHMDPRDLISGFVEFLPFVGRCKFRDCQHQHEPGCALLEARDQGQISAERLSSYFHILSTLPEQTYP
jgi:ribosome biogenesis GTPase / thiamine phosphate phosphatase